MSHRYTSSNHAGMHDVVEWDDQTTASMERHLGHLTALNNVGSAISQSPNSQTLLDDVLTALLAALPVDLVALATLDGSTAAPRLRAHLGWEPDQDTAVLTALLTSELARAAIEQDAPTLVPDVTDRDDQRLNGLVAPAAAAGIGAWVLVPMHARGTVSGLLIACRTAPYQFPADEITVLRVIADQVGVALDYGRLVDVAGEQTSRLSAVANSTGDAIIATDRAGRINLVNATAEVLFNLRLKNILGLPLRDAPLHPVIRRNVARAMQTPVRGNTVFEAMLDDGRFLSVVVAALPPTNHSAPLESGDGWVIVVRDMTALRNAEQARANFIHAAAHDLRNPLGVAMGALSMLQQTLDEASDFHREIVGIGVEGITRMEHMLDNLLDLEKLERGRAITADHHVEIAALIERGLADIQPFIDERGQELRLELIPDLPTVSGDLHWLSHALRNLLRNASKYTPEGGTITLRAYTHASDVFIEVEDNGPGIPSEAQGRLFERFYRVTHSDEARGSGLGLTIVKSVVELHNGRVFLQSEPGAGSLFGMVLPCFPPC